MLGIECACCCVPCSIWYWLNIAPFFKEPALFQNREQCHRITQAGLAIAWLKEMSGGMESPWDLIPYFYETIANGVLRLQAQFEEELNWGQESMVDCKTFCA